MRNIKKVISILIILVLGVFQFQFLNSKFETVEAANTMPVYRLYNSYTSEHFHTANKSESNYLSSRGWLYEGVSMHVPTTGNPVYRLYNPYTSEHFYTQSNGEKNRLIQRNWIYESIAWYAPNSGVPVHRLYNPRASDAGGHHFTTSVEEKNRLIRIGWISENTGWYSSSNNQVTEQKPQPQPESTNKVVDLAYKQLGIPYVWGGTTRSGFDCSGLTQYVYKNAKGKNIGRVTTNQERSGTIIPISKAQPGDLLFWGTRGSTYHVAIYVGNGNYIHAPQPGQNVKVQNMRWYMPSFALRVN